MRAGARLISRLASGAVAPCVADAVAGRCGGWGLLAAEAASPVFDGGATWGLDALPTEEEQTCSSVRGGGENGHTKRAVRNASQWWP